MKAGSEAAWQQTVTNLATYEGWRWYHSPANRPVKTRSGRVVKQHVVAGFPDLVLVRGPQLIFAELKTDTGRMGPGQQDWLDALGAVGEMVTSAAGYADVEGDDNAARARVEAVVWRPKDFEAIVRPRLARVYAEAIA